MSDDPTPDRREAGPFCVVIPAFQAADTIGSVVRRALPHVSDVIVVNDGSVDGTGDAAREARAQVVDHPVNLGKGPALRTGLRHAYRRGYRDAVTLDADGQHDPDDIPALLEAARGTPGALILGARDMGGSAVPKSSRFGRWFTNLWVRIDGGGVVGDAQSGFRCYPIPETLALRLQGGRFEFEMEVILRSAWAGIPVASVPVSVHYDEPGRRVSHLHPLVDNTRISLLFAYLFVARWIPHLRRPGPALPWPPEDNRPGEP